MAEVARRKLDIHDKITDAMVKETYDFEKLLGQGASGEVCLVRHRKTGQLFACKTVKKDGNMNDAQSMSTEIEIMKRVRHRHIVSMYELYETPNQLWIILELVDGGDLQTYIAHHHDHSEATAATQVKQLLKALHYLHSLGIVHRDIKLANILLKKHKSGQPECKLADFGLSALVRLGEDGYDPDESGKRKLYTGLRDMWGTKEYFAPEVIAMKYGPQADMWSLGCVVYEMLVGKTAFPYRDSEEELFERIEAGKFGSHRPGWVSLSDEAKSIITDMLHINPLKRLSATEALHHPWILHNATDEAIARQTRLTEAQGHHRASIANR
jgi:serine/threonine protein kinase